MTTNTTPSGADALRAALEALQKPIESRKDEWLSWQAKREALEKDAARYRWLRERISVWRTNDGKGPVSWCPVSKVPATSSLQDETDAAIDQSIAAQQKGGAE